MNINAIIYNIFLEDTNLPAIRQPINNNLPAVKQQPIPTAQTSLPPANTQSNTPVIQPTPIQSTSNDIPTASITVSPSLTDKVKGWASGLAGTVKNAYNNTIKPTVQNAYNTVKPYVKPVASYGLQGLGNTVKYGGAAAGGLGAILAAMFGHGPGSLIAPGLIGAGLYSGGDKLRNYGRNLRGTPQQSYLPNQGTVRVPSQLALPAGGSSSTLPQVIG